MGNLPVSNSMNYNMPQSMGMGMSGQPGGNPAIMNALKGKSILKGCNTE